MLLMVPPNIEKLTQRWGDSISFDLTYNLLKIRSSRGDSMGARNFCGNGLEP
jgi:hypothetical protein